MQKQRAMFAVRAACAAFLVICGACHKRPSGPSAHYEKGAAIHQELYVRELDDAYLDPRMDDAVKELKQVEPDSVSAHVAQDLLAQIEQGKKDASAVRDARAKALAASTTATTIDPNAVLRADARPVISTQVEVVDAGAALDPYGPGAPIADINRDTGGCLVAGTPFREEGSGKSGTTYKLAEDPTCRSKLPGFVNQTVLALDGRIYRRVGNSEVKTEKVLPGAPGTLPDGGVPPTSPAAAALNPPQGAAAGQPAAGTVPADTVAAQQNATPPPAPAPNGRQAVSPTAADQPNVAAEQNATPNAPPPATPGASMQDATPPPAQQ